MTMHSHVEQMAEMTIVLGNSARDGKGTHTGVIAACAVGRFFGGSGFFSGGAGFFSTAGLGAGSAARAGGGGLLRKAIRSGSCAGSSGTRSKAAGGGLAAGMASSLVPGRLRAYPVAQRGIPS